RGRPGLRAALDQPRSDACGSRPLPYPLDHLEPKLAQTERGDDQPAAAVGRVRLVTAAPPAGSDRSLSRPATASPRGAHPDGAAAHTPGSPSGPAPAPVRGSRPPRRRSPPDGRSPAALPPGSADGRALRFASAASCLAQPRTVQLTEVPTWPNRSYGPLRWLAG